jgi:FAD dependent oxidoreductase TIGR03364
MTDSMNRNPNDFDIAIVGAGIVGLANALAAARRGQRVLVCDRSPFARGASIRNFGMIWPIGQPAGELREIALASREIWLELSNLAGIWVNRCGSLHLAHREDELAVLEEFCGPAAAQGLDVSLLSAAEVQQHSPAANPEGLLGGLRSQSELCVDPRQAIRDLPNYLTTTYGARFEYSTAITHADEAGIRAADGRAWRAGRTLICSGDDFESLFPSAFHDQPLRRCQLQMMRTVPQPDNWRIGPHLASGLTLRHYHSFADCPSLPALKQRIAAETPELDHFGIHVMASQNAAGHVILGDSHLYDDRTELTPFDDSEINNLILRELRKIIHLADWRIEQTWQGTYAKHADQPIFRRDVAPGVTVATATGGAGMTLSFGLAEKMWQAALPNPPDAIHQQATKE